MSIPEIEMQMSQDGGKMNMKDVSEQKNVVRLGRLRNREDGNRNRIYCTTIVLEIEINEKCAAAEVINIAIKFNRSPRLKCKLRQMVPRSKMGRWGYGGVWLAGI
jgi:hypothetical protein